MRIFVISLPAVLLCACPTEYPGERVGAYAVSAELDDSSCGPGVGGQAHRFDVELRRDGAIGYWIGPSGTLVLGAMDDQGSFHFRLEEWLQVRGADEETGLAACVLIQVDETSGTAADALVGREDLYVGAAPGASCNDFVGVGTGQFLGLPCEMHYSLEGSVD